MVPALRLRAALSHFATHSPALSIHYWSLCLDVPCCAQVCFHNRHPFDGQSGRREISMETQARIERKSLALKRSVAEKDLEKRALRAASAASANGDYAAARIARREANSHKVSAAQARSEARELRPHHWTALVQPCAACGDYAARWRCPPCEESYCAGCYSQLHAFGSRLTHACDRLGYYTAEIHARDERLFRANTRRVLERHRREAARAAEPTKRNRAAITIQRTYFATVGRVEGQRQLQESRHGQREAWQQLKNGASRHLDMGHLFLDLIGRAPFLSSDAKEQLAVKRVALWKHNPAMKYLNLTVPVEPANKPPRRHICTCIPAIRL